MGFIEQAVSAGSGAIGGGLGDTLGGFMDPLTHTNFQAAGAPVVDPVNGKQIDAAYDQTQTGLKQQQDFLAALQAQNGISNQSSVFGQQQGLADQLQGVANGTGPNPAMAQLAQQTGANIASQSALMAGQRGTSANAGLLARQAAMNGGNIQQQAVGQGATMQANQSLGAMQALQGQQANMANLSTNQVGQQATASNAYTQNALAQQQNLLGAQGQFNNSLVGSTSSMNSANGQIAGQQLAAKGQMIGGAGSALTALSDENAKKNIKDGDAKVTELLEHSKPHAYNYKDPNQPGAGTGEYVSPMAQDLEKSEIGSQMVQNTPNGKEVDYGKGMGAMLAAQSQLHERIKQLEAQLGKQQAPSAKTESRVKMADGGEVTNQSQNPMIGMQAFEQSAAPKVNIAAMNDPNGPQSYIGRRINGAAPMDSSSMSASSPSQQGMGWQDIGKAMGTGIVNMTKGGGSEDSQVSASMGNTELGGSDYSNYASKGARIPEKHAPIKAMLSPGELRLSQEEAKRVAQGKAKASEEGQRVPGKASVKGDSLKNDTVKADLKPGEVIVKRTAAKDDDSAARFVGAVMAKGGKLPKKGK